MAIKINSSIQTIPEPSLICNNNKDKHLNINPDENLVMDGSHIITETEYKKNKVLNDGTEKRNH